MGICLPIEDEKTTFKTWVIKADHRSRSVALSKKKKKVVIINKQKQKY